MEKLAKEKEVVGIYISGHPLDDYKFEMRYFCNSKLEALKELGLHVNKNLSVGGIITNVQHKIAKNGKGWASFTLEGFDESYEFRIFGEEYLKFRHYLIPNNFTYIRLVVKEGWVDKETGKKGEPRLQFLIVQYLQDVLPTFAKKLIIHMNIEDLRSDLIKKLHTVFQSNRGNHSVIFEVLELETTKKAADVVAPIFITNEDVISYEEDLLSLSEETEPEVNLSEEKDEIKIITKLSMPSRKLKIGISSELLQELEKMQINFRLN
jgi:DNA polymerase-3 subunit alpha